MLIFDPKSCTECQACRLKCSFVKETEYNPAKARLSIKGKWPLTPALKVCRQCQNPLCVKACPVSALSQDEQRIVSVDHGLCNDCGLCVQACPFKAVQTCAGKIYICDTCKGEYPCTKVCSTEAISKKG